MGGVLKYFTLGRATKMAALLYLFFNNPPNKKKKIPLHKKWLTILFQSAPPSSSLYLSPSLFLPVRAPSRLKNVHIVTSKKRRGVCDCM